MKKLRNTALTRLPAFLCCAALLAALCLPAYASGETSAEAARGRRIRVFETTDIHGYLMDISSGSESTFQYRLAYIADIVNDTRRSGEYDDVLLLDGGDTFQGAPVSNLLLGSALRAAMDAMDYDAMVLGNHEFDWGLAAYNADPDGTVPAYELGDFSGDPDIPILAYNLRDAESGERVSLTRDYTVVEKAGCRVALIGYIPNYSMDIIAEQIAPYSIDGDLAKLAERVREINAAEKPDITVVMAHADPEPVANAMDPDEVDLVTGGHSHRGVCGAAENGIPYIQGGCNGQGYAAATLVVADDGTVAVEDTTYTQITADRSALYDTPENADALDGTILEISRAAWAEVSDQMSETLGYIDTPIDRTVTGDNGSTTGGNWFTGLMLRETRPQGVVAAFYNSGGIRASLTIPSWETTRTVTVGDVYAVAPFNNYWFIYEITGAELARQLADAFKNGNYGDQMSGLTFEYLNHGTDRYPDIEIVSITLDDGTEVDIRDEKTLYRVCTSNYNSTLAGSVFEDKEPLVPEAEAPIDNITMVELLRQEARDNDGYIAVDTGARGVCLNAAGESGEPSAEP